MRIQLIIAALLLTGAAYGQDSEKTPVKKVQFGFGMNMNVDFLDPSAAEEDGISKTAFTWLDMSGRLRFLKYFNADLGFTLSRLKDELPFTQAVTFTSGTLQGLPSTAKSRIVAGGVYYAAGVNIPVVKEINLIGSVGSRRFSATRTITNCTDCNRVELPTKAGHYIQAGFGNVKDFGDGTSAQWHLLYSNFFESDSDFNHSITLGFMFLY